MGLTVDRCPGLFLKTANFLAGNQLIIVYKVKVAHGEPHNKVSLQNKMYQEKCRFLPHWLQFLVSEE